jgi:hypothetical protein
MAKEGAERAVLRNLSQRRRFLVFAPGVSKRRSLIPPSGALPHLADRVVRPRRGSMSFAIASDERRRRSR